MTDVADRPESKRPANKETDAKGDVLAFDGVDVAYRVRGRDRAVIRDLSLRIGPGGAYGLVGESGCGKSTAAFAAMRYLAGNGRVTAGRIRLAGTDIMAASEAELRAIRASAVSMVYQDPGKSLNPAIRVGRQLEEVFRIGGASANEARRGAGEMLDRVRIVDPASVMERYPHELSGGMQQRIVIAMALAANPALLILDEPTTGLDVTVEAEVLDLVSDLRNESGAAILFISHDLAVVSQVCERVGVLYAGMLVEEGTTGQVFGAPRHPYTKALLRCLPSGGQKKADGRLATIRGGLPGPGAAINGCPFTPRCPLAQDICRTEMPKLKKTSIDGHLARCHFAEDVAEAAVVVPSGAPGKAFDYAGEPLLRAMKIDKSFDTGPRTVRALSDVSFDIWPGETIGIVGESGSGKSTLARVLLGLSEPDAGSALTLRGAALPETLGRRTSEQVKAIQIVFQNPDSALNRSHNVGRIVGRAARMLSGIGGARARERVRELAEAVRLPLADIAAKPRRLSGGLKQRVAIARAFAGKPDIVVCDEPTSALDVSVQAAILNLLVDLQAEHGTAYVFISHDLSVVRYISDRILVLYMGRVMEFGPAADILSGPRNPYTDTLLAAAPTLGGEAKGHVQLKGELPSAMAVPDGCVFHSRCPHRIGPICDESEPPLAEIAPHHQVRCHLKVADLPGARAD